MIYTYNNNANDAHAVSADLKRSKIWRLQTCVTVIIELDELEHDRYIRIEIYDLFEGDSRLRGSINQSVLTVVFITYDKLTSVKKDSGAE
jgi:hypothetical protein